MLFENTLVDGKPQLIGAHIVRVAGRMEIVRKVSAVWGAIWRGCCFRSSWAMRQERTLACAARRTQAWGWLPPPLVGEGQKVQTDWLHNFLMDPFPIRPAVVLRMPKFNMSSEEASMLVHYFAAHDNAEYPYEFDLAAAADHIEQMEDKHPKYLEGGLTIVTDNNYLREMPFDRRLFAGRQSEADGPAAGTRL